MKKYVFGFCFLILASYCYSAPPVMETPINGFGTPVTVAISSTNMTMVPTSQTSGRVGIFLSNPFSNPLPIVGFYGNCTSTSLANTIRPIEIAASTTTTTNRYFSMREDVCLWLLSTNTGIASQNISYQEVKQ